MTSETTLGFLLFSLSSLCRIAAYLDIEELRSAAFGLEILDEPISVREPSENTLNVVSRHGQPYRCAIPSENDVEAQLNRNPETDTPPQPEANAVEQLLSRLTGTCLHKTKGWWTYEFCYNQYVRQYHLEGGKRAGVDISLGEYRQRDNDEDAMFEDQSSFLSKSSYVHEYVNGDKCDLTGLSRRTQVKFVCEQGGGDYIAHIEEPSSCSYVLYVNTMHICHHPYFKPKEPGKVLKITCSPLLKHAEYQLYVERKENVVYEPGTEHEDAVEYEKTYDEEKENLGGGADDDDDHEVDGGKGGGESFPMENVVKKLMGMLAESGTKAKASEERSATENEPEDVDRWKVRVRKVKNVEKETRGNDNVDDDDDDEAEATENDASIEAALTEAKDQIEKAFKEKLEEAGLKTEGEVHYEQRRFFECGGSADADR
ncbi:protein OS-9-like isoform X2 [Oscarella lobularis]|uniref:protein OS-9-like isoform X2 n=1 Tax=Oscarella lobularis TaxID=121494 RepID=UPI0033140D2F